MFSTEQQRKPGRKDDIVEFARGEVYYRVGSNGYVADVLVGIRKNGAAVLYDLKNIYEKEITDTPLAMASQSPQRSEDVSVTDNISQANSDVKEKYSRRLKQFIAHVKSTLREYAVKDKTVEAALNAEIKELEELARNFDAALTEARKKISPPLMRAG